MKWIVYFLFTFNSMVLGNLETQSISDFKWKKRLVIVFEEQIKRGLHHKQIDLLIIDPKGLEERRLLLLQVKEKKVFDQYNNLYSQQVYTEITQLRRNKSDFEVLLIGLDGSIELRKSNLVEKHNLFSLIDGMPMRRAERLNKKHVG